MIYGPKTDRIHPLGTPPGPRADFSQPLEAKAVSFTWSINCSH
jgi:hypothetical protein